jgi:hypothetical protein
MVNVGFNITVDDNGYGYYCDPSKLEYDYFHPPTGRITGLPQYYTFHNPDNIIYEEDMDDYEYRYKHTYHHRSRAVTDKINTYTNLFIYGCIVIVTVTVTSMLVHYNIL